MSTNIVLDINRYPEVAIYAKRHNISVKQLVEDLLTQFQFSIERKGAASLQLPPRLEKLGGCLADVSDPSDEKLNYLLEKYK